MWPAMYGGCVALMEVPKPTDAWAPVVMTSVSMQVQKDVIVTSACGPVAPSSAPQQLGQAQPVAQTVSTCEPPQEAVAGLKCVTKRGAVVVVSRAPVQGAQVHGEKQAQDRNAAATKAAKELKNDHQSKRQRQETAVAPVVKFKDGSSGQSMQAAQGVFVKEEKEDGELEEGEIVEKVTRSNKEARKRPRFDPPVQGPEIRRGTSVGGLSAGMNGALQEPRTVGHRSGVSSPPSGAPTTSGAQTNAFATGSFFPVVSSGHLPQIYPTISQPHPTPNVPLEPMQQQQPQQHLPQIPQNVIVQGTHVLHDTLKPRFAIVGPAMGNMAQRPLMVDQQVNQQPLMSQQPFIINQGINRPPLIVRPVQHPPQQPQPSIYAGAAPAVAVPGNQHVVGLQQPLLGPQLGVQQIPGQLNPLQPPQSPQPPQPPQHNVLNLQQFPAFGGLQTSSQGGQGPIEALPIQSMGLNVVPRQYPFFQ